MHPDLAASKEGRSVRYTGAQLEWVRGHLAEGKTLSRTLPARPKGVRMNGQWWKEQAAGH